MLRFILFACLTAFVATTPVFAHQGEAPPATGVELGTLFGLHYLDDEATSIAVPTAPLFSFFGIPALYVSWFPGEHLAIGPEFSFGRSSLSGDDFTSLYLGGRGAFFLQSNAVSGPYLLGKGALVVLESDIDADAVFFVGAGLGYQWRVGPAFVLRTEGQYQRGFDSLDALFDDGSNNFLFLLGLGTRLGGR